MQYIYIYNAKNMKDKSIVWALFDDGYCSYKKTIKKFFHNQFIVFCIGIQNKSKDKTFDNKNYFYKQINLSLTNNNLLKLLSSLPKPNIILASPLCESWSTADCNGRMFLGIESKKSNVNLWKVKNFNFYQNYNKKCHPVKHRWFLQKEKSRLIGEETIGATINIIQTFKPNVWIIENPYTSKIWNFLKYHWNFYGYDNKTYYSSYDSKSYSLKPTIFKSNIVLKLKNNKQIGNKKNIAKSNYEWRSAIPSLLIKDIINQIKDRLMEK